MRRLLVGLGLIVMSSLVFAETLEDRVKSLEEQVAELQAMIAKLSIAALGANSESKSEDSSSAEDGLAALMFLAAMRNAMDETVTESEVNLDCIKELDAKMKPLEQNSAFTTVGWMLKYESKCEEAVIAKVNLEWYTSDDFLLERETAFARFEPNSTGQANGEKRLFSTEKYEKVDKFKISIVR